jgi:hypothetical protein
MWVLQHLGFLLLQPQQDDELLELELEQELEVHSHDQSLIEDATEDSCMTSTKAFVAVGAIGSVVPSHT